MTDETEIFFSGGKRYKRNKETGKVERMPDETQGISLEVWKNHAKYVAELKDMLKRLQWAGTAYGVLGSSCRECPICHGFPVGEEIAVGAGSHEHGLGHKPDCELGRLLDLPDNE